MSASGNIKEKTEVEVTSTVIDMLESPMSPEELSDSNSEEINNYNYSVELQRQYLNRTVVPALRAGLLALVKERPEDPFDFLAAFLLKFKEDHEKDQDGKV